MDRLGFAAALKSARARVHPRQVGLDDGDRRRVPGLRREEVARLANVSVDYIVRLEQGRGTRPSQQVVAALARALRLSDDERDDLFHLAGWAPPAPGRIDAVVRPSTRRVLDRLDDLPAVVMDAKGDLLAWNAMATAVLGDFSAWPPPTRNVVWQRFFGTDVRVSATPEEDEQASIDVVAHLRAISAKYPKDPGLGRLLDELRGNERFCRLWAQGRPATRRSSTKSVRHPDFGLLDLDCDSLFLPDTDQRLVVYSAAPASHAAIVLAQLRRTTDPSGIGTAR